MVLGLWACRYEFQQMYIKCINYISLQKWTVLINLFFIVRTRKVLHYHRKTMVGKGVDTVTQLFLKLCLHVLGQRTIESQVSGFLVALIFICLPFILFYKSPVLHFVLMLISCLSCTFTKCSLRCLCVAQLFSQLN